MYLQTSRLQYNLQKVGVFQTAHSDKNIQAEACRYIIPQKYEEFKQNIYSNPQSGLDNRISRLPRFVYREFDFRSQRDWEQ